MWCKFGHVPRGFPRGRNTRTPPCVPRGKKHPRFGAVPPNEPPDHTSLLARIFVLKSTPHRNGQLQNSSLPNGQRCVAVHFKQPRGGCSACFRKVDVRLPGKANSNSHGARPVHLIITMIKRIRTSRLSIKISLSGACSYEGGASAGVDRYFCLSLQGYLVYKKQPPP